VKLDQYDKNAILKYVLLAVLGVTSGMHYHSVAVGIMVTASVLLALVVGSEIA
jgi:hypothetical protein